MEELILKLREQKVGIKLAGENLELEIPDGVSIDHLLPEIRAHKSDLIEFMGKQASGWSRAIPRVSKKDFYPLSSAQKRLYFLFELNRESTAYNMPQAIRIEGNLNVNDLKEALYELIIRHQVLRSTFAYQEGALVQQVRDSQPLPFDIVSAIETNLDQGIADFIKPFDLNNQIPIRAGLLALSERSHVLLIDIHHIATDGLSENILIKEFMSLYEGDEISESQLQYVDYCEWQEKIKSLPFYQKAQTFWVEEFQTPVDNLKLNGNHLHSKSNSGLSRAIKLNFSKLEHDELKVLSKKQGTTMFMTFFSAVIIALSRFGRSEDITIGVPVTGRVHRDLEDIQGLFASTLPIRNQFDLGITAAALFQRVKEKVLACFDHQVFPFEELLEHLNLDRDLSGTPLFNVLFDYQNFTEETLNLQGLKVSALSVGTQEAKFDITIFVTEYEDEVVISLEYATDLFRHELMLRLTDSIKKILSQVATDDQIEVGKISILDQDEKENLIVGFNQTATTKPDFDNLLQLVTHQVKENPDSIALSFDDEQLSYSEMSGVVNSWRKTLVDEGLQVGEIVGVSFERPLDMVLGMLAIMTAGGAFLPIDETFPKERIDYLLEDSRTSFVITEDRNASLFEDRVKVICPENKSETANELDLPEKPPGLAYVIYTSGSTGQPKGVSIRHAALLNYLDWAMLTYIKGKPRSMAIFSSLNFDLSLTSVFLPLTTGNTIHLYDQKSRGFTIKKVLEDGHANLLKMTPSHLKIVLEGGYSLSHVEGIVLGGEALESGLAQSVQDAWNHIEIYNEYGPTEATIGCICYQFDQSTYKGFREVPIGKPIGNTQAYVLDSKRNPVPIGVTGELFIGGDCLADGYINHEELTRNKFVAHPIERGKILYQTGDLAYWTEEGDLIYQGRTDDIIKFHGYRVSLGEIEGMLQLLVQQVIVLPEMHNGEQILVAYVVNTEPLNMLYLKKQLRQRLPVYMIPSQIIEVKKIPLTANGKVDKKQLQLSREKPKIAALENEKWSDLEVELARIWNEGGISGKIEKDATYFQLGGYSLGLLKSAQMTSDRFLVEIPVDFYFSNTFRQVAQELENRLS